jgi:hypothetical protein
MPNTKSWPSPNRFIPANTITNLSLSVNVGRAGQSVKSVKLPTLVRSNFFSSNSGQHRLIPRPNWGWFGPPPKGQNRGSQPPVAKMGVADHPHKFLIFFLGHMAILCDGTCDET